ncbi:dihydroxyacetone kinase subunit DhaL [Mesobacillus subterraneus]|uniref:phosphoenolpyruvate--glycerone phosphotransferase n=1 Tax=Mesobacillus subterraneus TaxID=285983 RepID=A0A0D6ZB41_9BACI|nr:dihydroxyacetone kinase subunit DhaL [Mesobacillus subterraneus]KIY21783.1 dihydroxyacetone kinase [Mesobacillus subterraneus]
MAFTVDEAKLWLINLNKIYQQEKMYLSELDQAIGDGDHGINMARGFNELNKKLETAEYHTTADLFKDAGMVLLSKVGGASGPLYGTAFIKAGGALKDKEEVTKEELAAALFESLEGLKLRGKARLEDKTMLDVWIPAIEFLQNHPKVDWDEFKKLVKEKMEGTKKLEAKKGRASYLGIRSVGHIDPGAASSYLLFVELARVCEGVGL